MMMQEQILQLDDVDFNIIRDRNEDIKELESQMIDLAEIFRDLSVIVHGQGEQIDVSAMNVEHASENIVIAERHLEEALVIQTKVLSFYWKGALVFGGVALGGVGLAFFVPIAGIVTSGVAATGALSFIGLALKRK